MARKTFGPRDLIGVAVFATGFVLIHEYIGRPIAFVIWPVLFLVMVVLLTFSVNRQREKKAAADD
jgi:hypothetical protein